MSIALTSQTTHHRLRTKQCYLIATPSGLYVPGGDVVDLTKISLSVGQSADSAVGYPGVITDYGVISAPAGYSAKLIKGATLSTWGLQVFQDGAAAPAGVPLSLGTLSAAGTNSTYTAAGLLTVLTATPPPLGSIIVHSNGATAKGIFFSGIPVKVTAVVAGTSYSCNFGQGVALAYASAVDTLKYQVVQAGSSSNLVYTQPLAAPITGVLATTALLTITQANSFKGGEFVYLDGPFKAASVYALGAIVQVNTATAASWTAKWQGTVINQTSLEVGVASQLVTNGGAPVVAYPQAAGPVATITNSLAVASAANAEGLFTLTAAQAFQPGMIGVVQGLGVNSTANGSLATVIATSLTQALIKANGWTVIENTSAETAGYMSILQTGPMASLTGELPAATYPAALLASSFVFMIEGPKLRI